MRKKLLSNRVPFVPFVISGLLFVAGIFLSGITLHQIYSCAGIENCDPNQMLNWFMATKIAYLLSGISFLTGSVLVIFSHIKRV